MNEPEAKGLEEIESRFDQITLRAHTKSLESEPEVDSEVKEVPTWLTCSKGKRDRVQQEITDEWIVTGKPKMNLDDEDRYCSRQLVTQLLEAKDIFDTIGNDTLRQARIRANPYEALQSGFFLNRSAMKTANLDKVFGWRLSGELEEESRLGKNPMEEGKPRENTDRENPLFYFVDVCGGPGGFSEYMLWRKAFYNAKGFGITSAGKEDFKLGKFQAASPEYFEPYYGVKENGNVMDPDNLESLERFVHERIHGPNKGVHLVMCDGAFSVEGQEKIQEILYKRLTLCQFITGLSLCRVNQGKGQQQQGGNFLCSIFDMFTPFTIGLLYLMYTSFERISIHKPITSRPGNSERFIFCENMNQLGATKVKQYLVKVNRLLNEMDKHKGTTYREDILQLVPKEIIEQDHLFMNYIQFSNERIACNQIFYLHEYKRYAEEPGMCDQEEDQAKLRQEAMVHWELPSFIQRPRNYEMPQQRQRQQPRETAYQMVKRFARDHPLFPRSKQLVEFTGSESQLGEDLNELQCALLVNSAEPFMLTSQGGERLSMQKRDDLNFCPVNDLHCSIPKDTILLAQFAYIYEDDDGKFERLPAKCVWILDAAVLNGDNICHLEWKDRLAAARKFADAVNRRQLRRVKYEQIGGNPYGRNRPSQSQFAGFTTHPFSELLVADPMQMKGLTQRKFHTTKINGAKTAAFPVWAMDEPRDQPPQHYFLTCRGVRVVNRLNQHNLPANFYEHMIGQIPNEEWISAFPMGHPTNGAITFQWSWEPDYNLGFEVENILNDPEHEGGLTMPKLKQLLAEHANGNC